MLVTLDLLLGSKSLHIVYTLSLTVPDEEAQPHDEIDHAGIPAAGGGRERYHYQPEPSELTEQHRVEEPERQCQDHFMCYC